MLSCVLCGTGLSLRAFRFPLAAAAAVAEGTPIPATLFPIVHPTNPTVSALTMLFVVVTFFCLILCFATSAEPSRGWVRSEQFQHSDEIAPCSHPCVWARDGSGKEHWKEEPRSLVRAEQRVFLGSTRSACRTQPGRGGEVGRRRKAPEGQPARRAHLLQPVREHASISKHQASTSTYLGSHLSPGTAMCVVGQSKSQRDGGTCSSQHNMTVRLSQARQEVGWVRVQMIYINFRINACLSTRRSHFR